LRNIRLKLNCIWKYWKPCHYYFVDCIQFDWSSRELSFLYTSQNWNIFINKLFFALYKIVRCMLDFALRTLTNPGKPSSDIHDQIRKIILKTTTAKTTTFNRKKFGICLREKTMIDYVICTVIPKVIITWYHTCHTVGLTFMR
jgi:hypothetical protein